MNCKCFALCSRFAFFLLLISTYLHRDMSSLEVPDADIKVPQTLVDRVTAVLQVSCKRDVESVIAIVTYNFTKLLFESSLEAANASGRYQRERT